MQASTAFDPGPRSFPRRRLLVAAGVVTLVAITAASGFAAGRTGRAGGDARQPGTLVAPAAGPVNVAGGYIPTLDAGAAGTAKGPTGIAATLPAGQGAASTMPYPAGCAQAPSVQLQSRGVSATGTATIPLTASGTSTISASLSEQGGDAGAVLSSIRGKVEAVVAALVQAGVARSAVNTNYLNAYQDKMSQRFSASASVSATVPDAKLQAANAAMLQAGGISGYSINSGPPTEPSAAEINTAVSAAATQAKDMAQATARAMGVTLGSVDSVVTQPPATCYLQGGPVRAIQVTATYSVK